MALVSQTSPSSYTRSEISWYKYEQSVASAATCNVECCSILRVKAPKLSSRQTGISSLSWNTVKTPWESHSNVGYNRGLRMVVFASPPTEDAVVAAEPLTKEDLVGYLASGCKPKEKWRYTCTTFSVLQFCWSRFSVIA